jgi:hypothetical protein
LLARKPAGRLRAVSDREHAVLLERLDGLSQSVAGLRQEIRINHDKYGERFNAGRKRFADHNNRLVANEGRLANVETDLNDHEQRLRDVVTVPPRVTTLETASADHESRIRVNEQSRIRFGVIAAAATFIAAGAATALTSWIMASGH